MKAENIRYLNGSFTIEAIVVVPFIVLIMTASVFIGFFYYDKAVMDSVNICTMLDDSQPAVLYAKVSDSLSAQLIGTSKPDFFINADQESRRISMSADFMIPLTFINLVTDNKLKSLNSDVSISNLNGRKKLLLYKSICDGIKDVLNR